MTYDSFESVLGEKGYTQLPNGLIFQWGKVEVHSWAEDDEELHERKFETFPMAFPHECLFFSSDVFDMVDEDYMGSGPATTTKEGFFYIVNTWMVAQKVPWLAIGW